MSTKVSAKTKGWVKNNETGEVRYFMFNPTDFEYSRAVSYNDISSPGMRYPGTQFCCGNAREFTIDLFLYDRPYTGKIDKDYMLFFGALLTSETNKSWDNKKPPSFTFCLGYFVRICVLTSLTIKIEMWDSDMNPVQARFTCQIRQVSG